MTVTQNIVGRYKGGCGSMFVARLQELLQEDTVKRVWLVAVFEFLLVNTMI